MVVAGSDISRREFGARLQTLVREQHRKYQKYAPVKGRRHRPRRIRVRKRQ